MILLYDVSNSNQCSNSCAHSLLRRTLQFSKFQRSVRMSCVYVFIRRNSTSFCVAFFGAIPVVAMLSSHTPLHLLIFAPFSFNVPIKLLRWVNVLVDWYSFNISFCVSSALCLSIIQQKDVLRIAYIILSYSERLNSSTSNIYDV